jgi:hypothetical protein
VNTPMWTIAAGFAAAALVWAGCVRSRGMNDPDRVAISVSLGVLAAIANLIIPIPSIELVTVCVVCVAATFGLGSATMLAVIAVLGTGLGGGLGPWTAWQIVGFVTVAALGALAGSRRESSIVPLCVAVALGTVFYDVLLTATSLQLTGVAASLPYPAALRGALLLGLPYTVLHVTANVVLAATVGRSLMRTLERARQRTERPSVHV